MAASLMRWSPEEVFTGLPKLLERTAEAGIEPKTQGVQHGYVLSPHDRGRARHIVACGFRDSKGYYGTENLHSGVWLSDRPLDADEGTVGNALLRVELNIGDREFTQFEWIEDGKPYREWLIPACLINELGTIVMAEIRD